MSIQKLNELIDDSLKSIDLSSQHYKLTSSSKGTLSAEKGTFRSQINKVVHVLYLNDTLLQNLAPESISILTNGTDKTATQIILSKYRQLRSTKRERLVSYNVDNMKTYRLTFNSFNAVREFMDSIGLYGRPYNIFSKLKQNNTKFEKLLKDSGSFTQDYLDNTNKALKSLATLKDGTEEAKVFYREVYDNTSGFDVGHNIPLAYEKVSILAENPEILAEVVKDYYSAAGIKSSYSRKVNTIVKETLKSIEIVKKQAFDLNFIAVKTLFDSKSHNNGTIQVLIEDSVHNQGSESEIRLMNTFKTLLNNAVRRAITNRDDQKILSQQGSKSFIQDAEDRVIAKLLGKPYKVESPSKTKQKKTITVSTKVASIAKDSSILTSKVVGQPLRNVKGQFTSLINIESLIRARLRETIQKNMVKPALVYRSGRFADSVKLETIENRQGNLTAFLSYMKYPYATFEPGNAQGSTARSPSRLIDRSVREIAKTIVTARMKTVIV